MNVTVFEAINITKKYRNTLAILTVCDREGDFYEFFSESKLTATM